MKQGWQDQKVHKQEISQLLYIPTLAFLDYYAPINFNNVNVFVECGILWETFRVVRQLSRWFGFISFDSIALLLVIFASLKKQAQGCIIVAISLVCVLFDPAIPTSFFNFIQLFLYLFLFFFNALSVIYQCHLTWVAHNFCPV